MNLLPFFSEDSLELFERADAPLMVIKELNGAVLAVNTAALQMFELEGHSVAGKTTIDLGIWAQPQERSKLMHVLTRLGRFDRQRVQMRTRTGRILDVALSVNAVTLSKTKCFLATYIDITWQEQLEAKLRARHQQTALAHGASQPATWRFDSAAGVLFFSDSAHAMLELVTARDALLGLPLGDVIHPEDEELFLTNAAHQSGSNGGMDIQVRLHSRGHYRWYRLWRDAPDGSGGVEGIHSGKVLEMARLREAQKASLAANAAGMGTWETFPDGTAAWDPQMYRLYGHDPGTTLLPQDIFQAVQTPDGYARTARWLAKSLKYGLSLAIEFEIRWPDGQVRWLASHGGYSPASDFSGPSLLGVGWDVTDRRRAQSLLQQHRQELSKLTEQLLEQEKLTTSKLAQALHDQLGQTLTAARLMLDVQMNTQPTESGRSMGVLLGQAMEQVRSLLMELRPPMLEENGLGPALQNEIDRVYPPGLPCDITLDASEGFMASRWPANVEYAFFMIAREAISNALSHAKADLIQVLLRLEPQGLSMEVADDGQGFVPASGAELAGHLGLVGMKERAAAVHARLSFSSLLGDGTRVKLMWSAAQ
jgi:PAS domain S-box-containing protein